MIAPIVSPAEIDLRWSGTADQFDVYRGTSAGDLITAANIFVQTGVCQTSDLLATGAGVIFYYKVMPNTTP